MKLSSAAPIFGDGDRYLSNIPFELFLFNKSSLTQTRTFAAIWTHLVLNNRTCQEMDIYVNALLTKLY